MARNIESSLPEENSLNSMEGFPERPDKSRDELVSEQDVRDYLDSQSAKIRETIEKEFGSKEEFDEIIMKAGQEASAKVDKMAGRGKPGFDRTIEELKILRTSPNKKVRLAMELSDKDFYLQHFEGPTVEANARNKREQMEKGS